MNIKPGVLFLFVLFISVSGTAQDVALLNKNNRSLTYQEAIGFYTKLDQSSAQAKLIKLGPTDSGRNLHLFIISAEGIFDPASARKAGKSVILINNGIHPGEPDGIDASARLAEAYLTGKRKLPENVVICIVPVLNIDGSFHRSCCSRANQDGPEQYGFRGNGRNLDLNRDFIKCDSENTRSFTKLFREWDPDVFVDTHVSDGADYQYTMTLISTQHNKLGGPAGEFLKKEMTPALFGMMKQRGQEMSPYVHTSRYDDSPESGIYGFLETPRFASGYAALFQTLSFVIETHMLKPFPDRVASTIELLDCIANYTMQNGQRIQEARRNSREAVKKQSTFPLDWVVDSTRFEMISFKGYEAEYRKSRVTNLDQLYYNRQRPYTREIKFYDSYKVTDSINKPGYYIIPQAWKEIIDRFKLNLVQMDRFLRDTVVEVETYVIGDFKTVKDPYEGHYLHSDITVTSERKKVQYLAGDYMVPLNQDANRYIVESLEPRAPDSWFAWGFFDAVLQQKEWFSAYVFDNKAEQLLQDDPSLKERFEKKKSEDSDFAASSFQQLYFIYKNSPYFEDFRRYPVGKVTSDK